MTQMTMQTQTSVNLSSSSQTISSVQRWTGRVLSTLAVLFFLFDGGMKLAKPAVVVKATTQLGYPESEIVAIGAVLLACTLLYVVRYTSILGAILLTGYLGGAIASKVRIQASWFDVVFPLMLAGIVWGGLWLRDIRVRSLLR